MECVMEGGEWNSMDGVLINDEVNFMASLFSNSSDESYYTNDSNSSSNSNLYSLSQGSNYNENYYLNHSNQFFAVNNYTNVTTLPVEFCLDTKGVVQIFPHNLMERNLSLNLETSCDNLDDHLTQPEEVKSSDSSEIEIGGKMSRNSEVLKVKRTARTKRSRKQVSDDAEENPSSLKKQNSTGSCSSEEDLSVENPKVKTRASRGSTTDPQSLYARKRRERINERLRILQNLVPNGTKVDMSTMLEEAVNYVKFLQLQIKLLSSDDLWMFAPLAYNGMDIGLDAKLNSLL